MGQQNQSSRPEFIPVDIELFTRDLPKDRAVFNTGTANKVYLHKETGRLLQSGNYRTESHYTVELPFQKLAISPKTFEQKIFQDIFREFLSYSRKQYSIPTGLSVQDQIRISCVLLDALCDVNLTGEQAIAVHSLCIIRFDVLGLKVFKQIYDGCTKAVDQWKAEREILSVALSLMILD